MTDSNNKPIDWNAVALALGVDRATLPPDGFTVPRDEAPKKKPPPPEITGFALSDEEWKALRRFEESKQGRRYKRLRAVDRRFFNACIWRQRAMRLGVSWYFLPIELGKLSATRSRFTRWAFCGRWAALNKEVQKSAVFSDDHKKDFAGVVVEAERQRLTYATKQI